MLIIERFEGEYAVIETDDGYINIKRSILPDNCKEGDIITEENGNYQIEKDETDKRREKIKKLQNSLWAE